MCTKLSNEIIAYYVNYDSPVYCVTLDATNWAFDRVNYCKLFHEVMRRGLTVTYVPLMLNMHTSLIKK
jgi:hypothetical protein